MGYADELLLGRFGNVDGVKPAARTQTKQLSVFVWCSLGGDLSDGSDSLQRQPSSTTAREFSKKDAVFVRKAPNIPT